MRSVGDLKLEAFKSRYGYVIINVVLRYRGSRSYKFVYVISCYMESHLNGGVYTIGSVADLSKTEDTAILIFIVLCKVSVTSDIAPVKLGILSLEIVFDLFRVAVDILHVKFVNSALSKGKSRLILYVLYTGSVSLYEERLYVRRISVASEFDPYVTSFLDVTVELRGIYLKGERIRVSGSVGYYHIVFAVRKLFRCLLELAEGINTVKLRIIYGIERNVRIFIILKIDTHDLKVSRSEFLFGILVKRLA